MQVEYRITMSPWPVIELIKISIFLKRKLSQEILVNLHQYDYVCSYLEIVTTCGTTSHCPWFLFLVSHYMYFLNSVFNLRF